MQRATVLAILGGLGIAALTMAQEQRIEIALSPVGNPGNVPDPATARAKSLLQSLWNLFSGPDDPDVFTGYERVDYSFAIGTYEVTLNQYTAFLNAVAKKDPYELYNPLMEGTGNYSGQNTGAGIKRSGAPGRYRYSVIGNSGRDPVSYVSWLDAARFCNWLHNGQRKSSWWRGEPTETGAYTLKGDTKNALQTKNSGARWWIPSQNEWYKAAYYDPRLNGGAGGYWRFATQSNTPPGNVVGSQPNQANYRTQDQVFAVTPGVSLIKLRTNYITPVGSFTGSTSYYGTYDQNGNVTEWNDAIIDFTSDDGEKRRGIRGGGWGSFVADLQSTLRLNNLGRVEHWTYGFRVATVAEQAASKSRDNHRKEAGR